MKIENNKTNELVGKWFVTYTNDNKYQYQGKVLEVIDENTVRVQPYCWFTGFPSVSERIFKLSELRWQFFATNQEFLTVVEGE